MFDFHKLLAEVPDSDRKEIEERLLSGVVNRTAFLLYVWSAVILVFGVFSLDLLRSRLPDLTLFDNLWPRVILNTLPSLLLANWYSNFRSHTKLKAYLTPIVLPTLLVLASVIHAWPIFFSGDHNFYLYFHASNIIAMSSAIAITSGPPVISVLQVLGFLSIYFGPLLWLFHSNDRLLANMILSDVFFVSVNLLLGLATVHNLRVKLAAEDIRRKNKITPFLGENLTSAIYESSSLLPLSYTQTGIVLALDLRGYTRMVQSNSAEISKGFISDFHKIVTRSLGAAGGYLHKTSGDGVLATFGVMAKDEDVSDLPNLEYETHLASQQRTLSLANNAMRTFQEIVAATSSLKEKYNISQDLVIGAGIAVGDVDVLIRGDEKYRQELDIDGEAIIRAVRLEAYSKLLNKMVDPDSSFLVISPELGFIAQKIPGVKMWMTNTDALAVRDFPQISSVFFRQWKHNRNRLQKTG